MKKANSAIAALAIAVLVLAVLLIDTRGTMTSNAARDELRLLNYEAADYCLRLAMAFCYEEGEAMTSIYSEGVDMEHPTSFDGTRAILGIYHSRDVSDIRAPYAAYFIDYLVLDSGQSHLIRQTVSLTKAESPDGVVWWRYEIMGYQEFEAEA